MSLFFSESPTNPYLRCVDVPRISQLCRQHGALVVIDSTFATPVNQRVSPAPPFYFSTLRGGSIVCGWFVQTHVMYHLRQGPSCCLT